MTVQELLDALSALPKDSYVRIAGRLNKHLVLDFVPDDVGQVEIDGHGDGCVHIYSTVDEYVDEILENDDSELRSRRCRVK